MTDNHAWQKNDRFRIGTAQGTIFGADPGEVAVNFDHTGQAHRTNYFNAEWFNKHAEYLAPPPPTPQEVFDALPIGAYFTADGDGWVRVKTGPDRYVSASQELDFSYNLGRVPIEEVKR